MLRSLPPAEFECHVVVPAEPPLRSAFEETGAAVHVVPMERISRSHDLDAWLRYAAGWPIAVARLVRLIRSLQVDVVHTNSLHSWYGWAAAALTRRPHVWHAREIVVQSDLARRVERVLTRHFATRVIAMSDAIAAQLPGSNVVVIHETPDPDEFSPARAGRFRAASGIPDDVPLVGSAGRIDTWKGVDVLLDAFPDVKRRCPDAHLAIAGGPVAGKESYAAALRARAATLPDVHWLGPRDDLPSVLADLDVFVLPSTEPEPYGLVAVEALASGTPVVMTDAGGPQEIAAHATPGATRLVPPRDPAALAEAVGDVLVAGGARGPTSAARRASRPVLRAPEPAPFAAVFRAVADRAPDGPGRSGPSTNSARLVSTPVPPLVTVDVHLGPDDLARTLAADVRAGLRATPKELPPRWFYDDRGSALFEAITRLPEYYPTRAERAILQAHAREIATRSRAHTLVELGSGTSAKTRLLLDALDGVGTLERFVPLDVSEATLRTAARTIAADYGIAVHGVVGDFELHLDRLPRGGTRMVAFLGSTIGNLTPAARGEFLTRVAHGLDPDDTLLLGTDLVKDPARLVAAYDDATGVTAEFNRNVLRVVNRQLRADFEPEAFAHVARWDPDAEWVEMWLRAERPQVVRIDALDLEVEFAGGEAMRTEISAKFRRAGVEAELAAAGLVLDGWWTDPDGDFALSLARPAP